MKQRKYEPESSRGNTPWDADELSRGGLTGNDLNYRLLFEASVEGMLLATFDGIILDANPEACRILQRTRKEITATSLDACFDPSDPWLGPAREEQRRAGRFKGGLRLVRGDGTPFLAEVSIIVCQDSGNERVGVVFREVIEQGAENTPGESEDFYRTLVGSAVDMMAVTEADTTVRYVTPSVERLLGYKPEEWIGTRAPQNIHPEDAEEARQLFIETLMNRGVNPKPMELRYRRKDGTYRYHEVVINNLLHDPSVKGLLFNGRDTTERRRLEEELRFFRILVENTLDLIAVQEPDTTARYLSPSVERVLGYRPQELVGTKIADLVHPEDLEEGMRETAEVFSKPGPAGRLGEHRIRHKDGSYRYLQATANNMLDDPSIRGVLCTVRDVTERRELEEALRESEERYRRLVELSPEAVIVQRDGKFLYMNAAGVNLLGAASLEELAGRAVLDFVHQDYQEMLAAHMTSAQNGGGRTSTIEEKLIQLNGEAVDVEATSIPISYEGEPAVLSVVRDVSQRKRAEEVRSQRDFYETLLKAQSDVGEGLLVIEGELIRYANEAFCLISGYSAAELTALPTFLELAAPDQWPILDRQMRRRLRDLWVEDRYETAILHRSGRRVELEVGVRVLRREAQFPQLVVVARDITARKQAEEALRKSEEQLQDLVGKLLTAQEEERRRVAYEIHDGLAQVASAAYQHLQAFARQRLSPGAEEGRKKLDRALDLVRQTVEDARHVIADLRPTVLDDFGLAAAIRQKVEALKTEGWEIRYEEDIGEDRLPTSVETALYRVAQEALTNVRKHANTTQVRIELRGVGNCIRLRVQDQGRGFRLDKPSESSDLSETVGLSSMHERVALFGGRLEVNSQPDIGTSIVAEVPLLASPKEDADHAGELIPARLLIVDDHDLSRAGLRSMLESEEDLEVVGEATNGREAIELCRRLRPDVVLMDVRMPEMDGLTATTAIRQEHPRTSVIVVTMHEDPSYLYEALKAGAAGYVLKGATQSEMTDAVRKVLGGESLLNPALATRLLQRLTSQEGDPGQLPAQMEETSKPLLKPLTPRETQVLNLLAQGKSNREIAKVLVISPETAKLHVHRIITKLGVSDRTQAAIRAVKSGLLEPDSAN